MMRSPQDTCSLEESLRAQPIGATIFLPFAIVRLRGEQANIAEVTLSVLLRGIDTLGEETHRLLRIFWNIDNAPILPSAVQERTVTEWAACGVACALISLYAGLSVRSVAAEGDRFDYWVSDGTQDYGLEISGTMSVDIETRHHMKVQQLRENPYGIDGFVVVVDFATREAILSFHRLQEEPY